MRVPRANVIIDPLLSGPKELEKVNSPVFARLIDTQLDDSGELSFTRVEISKKDMYKIQNCCIIGVSDFAAIASIEVNYRSPRQIGLLSFSILRSINFLA